MGLNDAYGLVKIVGDKKTDRILDKHIIGANSSEMIGEGVLAFNSKMTIEELCHSSHAHPTPSETILEAAMATKKKAIHG